MKTILYQLLGSVSLGLGVIGIFLPLLPTTCFVLLSAWAFAKSSPSMHEWILNKSPFSNTIQNWQKSKCIPKQAKWFASLSILFSFSLTSIFSMNLYVVTFLGIGLLFLLIYVWSIPSNEFSISNYKITDQQIHGWHQPII